MLALIVEALRASGLDGLQVRIGDLGLFRALINAIADARALAPAAKHKFWRSDAFRAELTRLKSGTAAQGRACRAR